MLNQSRQTFAWMRNMLTVFVILALLLSSAVALPMTARAEVLYGDVDANGSVAASDALVVLQITVGKVTPTEEQQEIGDVNADGLTNAVDALDILKFVVGKIDAFTAQIINQMTPEEQYYYYRDQDYKVDYSDFEQPAEISADMTPAEIVEKLGGTPKTGDVEGYKSTEDGKLIYTPLSTEAKRLGNLSKYNATAKTSGKITLNGTTVEYTIPKNVTAYDMVPITYSVTSNRGEAVHLEANAFEDADRYSSANGSYFDCNMPGEIDMDITYEGYVNGYDNNDHPKLNADPTKDVQGVQYPAFDVTELKKSGNIQSGSNYTWFKFSYKNTGNTILDAEGNSAFRFAPKLYKLIEGEWTYYSDNPNWYYPLLDYVYPGENGEFWVLFNAAKGYAGSHGFDPGEYRMIIYGMMRSEHERYMYDENALAGRAVTTATFEFTATPDGEVTTPKTVVCDNPNAPDRNGWLKDYEEFMTSFTLLEDVGAQKTTGTMYIQPAPWTEQIVLKVLHGNTMEMTQVKLPVQVETDSIKVNLNPYNKNYVIKEDGTREPMVMTQNMTDMRGHIDRGPYCNDIILNEILNIKEAGINTITTTQAYTGDYTGTYDMTMYMLDFARKLGFNYEGHALYPYRGQLAVNRVRASNPSLDLGGRKDFIGQTNVDAANGILARWNMLRYGDFYVYDKVTKEIPISVEENYGWMTYANNWRDHINATSDAALRRWLATAYNNNIDALNQKYDSSYESFDKISVVDESLANVLNGEVYHDWTAATIEYDLFRTAERVSNYKEMLKYADIDNAKVYVRTENALFLAPGISQTTTNPRYRHVYYEQRRAAAVPELLKASGIIYGDSSYCCTPFFNSEVYELTRQAAKYGFNTAKTPPFAHMIDMAVINDSVGKYEYSDKLCLDSYTMGCQINTMGSLFTWCKAIYEAGGVPGTMWMDYACDLYVTSTQYKELQFLNKKFQEMLATEEGKAWATSVPEEATQNPVADLANGGYSFPESYLDQELADLVRYNQILDYCHKN